MVWSSFFKTKSEVLDMPLGMVRFRAREIEVQHALTRVHLFFDLLLAFAEKEELETERHVSQNG